MNACVPKKLYVQALQHNLMVLGDGSLGSSYCQMRSQRSALVWQIWCLMRRDIGELSVSPPCKDIVRRPLPDLTMLAPWTCTSSFQICEKISFLCLSHPEYGILLWEPERTHTGCNLEHLHMDYPCTLDFSEHGFSAPLGSIPRASQEAQGEARRFLGKE